MEDVIIRKFKHTDIEDFIRLSKTSFAEESIAAGFTPEDFERETRRIFRWKMISYKLFTTLMGIKWEGFVAEKDGKVVGGGMYAGRNNHISILNLMVDPEYRRQGIGQALLVKRLERLSERGFPYVMAQVLDTNIASLDNIKKQDFEEFNRFSVYERVLPFAESNISTLPAVTVRDVNRSDRIWFREIEKRSTPPFALQVNGSAETQYFQPLMQKIYGHYAGYSKWVKALVVQGESLGFLCAEFQHQQHKGFIHPPVVIDEGLQYLPVMLQKVGDWLQESGKVSMIIEIPDHLTQIRDYLQNNGWKRQYTWIEQIKFLDERARHKIMGH